MISLHRRGFSLIEIMIVVAIIAIALSIAIPNYFHMSAISKCTVCVNNLRKITAAVEQWAIDSNIPSGVNLNQQQEDDLYTNYFRGGKPKCPSDGQYTLDQVGANPQVRCSNEAEGHKI